MAEGGNKLGAESLFFIELAAHIVKRNGQFIKLLATSQANRLLRSVKGDAAQSVGQGFQGRKNGSGYIPDSDAANENTDTESDEAVSGTDSACFIKFLKDTIYLLLILLFYGVDCRFPFNKDLIRHPSSPIFGEIAIADELVFQRLITCNQLS